MSTAVAHEIRNPLAAITQANALLQEDLTDPVQRRLSLMIDQNSQRLARMVEDILDISRVHPSDAGTRATRVTLPAAVATTCREWSQQTGNTRRLVLHVLAGTTAAARFDTDHLRRVLVNLLDNASRHASAGDGAIQVIVHPPSGTGMRLDVWSDGTPIEASVERHLFEPFFSSESRSSGLGLFICRELCDKHGASLSYTRCTLHSLMPDATDGASREGNAFYVVFQISPHASPPRNLPFDAATP
jgi:two-component system sensor histidine kinase PilS (NtrC family)